MDTTTETCRIEGAVVKVVYQAADTGYMVLKVLPKKQRFEITVTGYSASIQPGQHVRCEGEWVETRHYGKQFKSNFIEADLPSSSEGLELYLSSGLIKGMGKQTTKSILKAFGEAAIEVIEHEPQKLAKLPGIGKKRSEQMQSSWLAHKHVSKLIMFLQSHGIGMQRAIRIYKVYGDQAIARIQQNPYRLAKDIDGIGFKLADQIATSLGIEPTAPVRLQSALLYQLQEATQLGHSAHLATDIIQNTANALGLSLETCSEHLHSIPLDNAVITTTIDTTVYYYLKKVFFAEQNIAQKLGVLCETPGHMPSHSQIHKGIVALDDFLGYSLSDGQKNAIKEILSHKVTVLTGGPGVGKTTLVQSVVHILRKNFKIVKLCAPTGRAAKRMQESTGHPSQTIHRLLGMDPVSKKFVHQADNPIKAEYLIIDECSMLDVHLTDAVLSAIANDTGLLMVGDIDQLPSVGPGKVLKDLIQCQRIPVIELTEIFRQKATSRIITYSHRVRVGKAPNFEPSSEGLLDAYALFSDQAEQSIAQLHKLLTERIPQSFQLNPKEQIQVLCPMHKGAFGTSELNRLIQSWLNPQSESAHKVTTSSGQTFYQGDKIMQIKNNYDKDIFNGDIGFVTEVDLAGGFLMASFDGRQITYYFDELDEIQLAYAMSIHKSQGSEFPAVILPLHQSQYLMLERTLLYTAMTRAKKLLILLGQKKAFHMAIANANSHERTGFLQMQIERVFSKSSPLN